MYGRKSIGQRIGPWETPPFTGFSCKDFQSRATQSCLILKKGVKKPSTLHEIPYNWTLRRPVCQNLPKARQA